MNQDSTGTTQADAAGLTVPVEGLMERAANLVRNFSDAVEAHDGGASRLLHAYETVIAANRELADEVQAREVAQAEDQRTIATLNSEVARLANACREGLQAVKTIQQERDRAYEDLRTSRGDYAKLNETHEALIKTNARLAESFDKLLNDLSTSTRGIREGGRRLSEIVSPTPVRPRPRPQAQPQPVDQLESDLGQVAAQIGRGPRLVVAQAPSDAILERGDRAEADSVLDAFQINGRARA